MHKALDPRDDIDIPYVSREEGGSGHGSINDGLMRQLEDYIK